MTDRPKDAEGPSPFAALRDFVTVHLDALVKIRDDRTGPPTLVEHERTTKAVLALIKTAGHLFAEESKPRKSGEELKREDDAIRDEFARRLAAMLRAEEARGAPGADGKLGVRAAVARPVAVTLNISTPDAESFRRSSSQVQAALLRALERGERNL